MQKQKNIQIPIDTFNDIVELLHCLGDCTDLHNNKFTAIYKKVAEAIRKKRITMLHRETYAEIIHAKDDASKKDARYNYWATKELYSNSE